MIHGIAVFIDCLPLMTCLITSCVRKDACKTWFALYRFEALVLFHGILCGSAYLRRPLLNFLQLLPDLHKSTIDCFQYHANCMYVI